MCLYRLDHWIISFDTGSSILSFWIIINSSLSHLLFFCCLFVFHCPTLSLSVCLSLWLVSQKTPETRQKKTCFFRIKYLIYQMLTWLKMVECRSVVSARKKIVIHDSSSIWMKRFIASSYPNNFSLPLSSIFKWEESVRKYVGWASIIWNLLWLLLWLWKVFETADSIWRFFLHINISCKTSVKSQ